MVPILSGIIAGEGESITPRRAFWLSLVYVLAMAATYTVAGVLAGLFGKNLQAMFQEPWLIVLFVAIFVVLSLSMFGLFELQLPHRWQTALHQYSQRHRGGKFGGVAMLGIFSALIVGPCVAPPLAAALIVIGESGSPLLGGSALFALSMGMGAPLLAFGVLEGKYLPRAGAWMVAVKAVFGVGLLALAIWMLERILPGPVILTLWGVLAIGCGVFLKALERLPEGASGWRRLWKALGLVLLVVGAAEIVGALAGGDDWLRPLKTLVGGADSSAEHVTFRRVKSIDDLQAAVAQANAAGLPAMLDFYADWCVECIRMERNTFPDQRVQALLEQVRPLQADVTPHDDIDQALMAKFKVIGPPAILFFDRAGKEMTDYRLVGYFKPEEFAEHLQAVVDAQ
jgi:thiol:disulfide interchange protein DsbD